MTKQYKQPKEQEATDITLKQVSSLNEITGIIETVTTVPTGKPTNFINQFKFYSSGSTYRLYVYNSKADVWRFVVLT